MCSDRTFDRTSNVHAVDGNIPAWQAYQNRKRIATHNLQRRIHQAKEQYKEELSQAATSVVLSSISDWAWQSVHDPVARAAAEELSVGD